MQDRIKVCVRCLISKPISEFNTVRLTTMSGKFKENTHSYCKECLSKYCKKLRKIKKFTNTREYL